MEPAAVTTDGLVPDRQKVVRPLLACGAILATSLLCVSWMSQRSHVVVGALLVGLLAWQRTRIERYLPERPWQRLALALAWAGLVTGFLLHDNLGAGWGIIDDHDIPAYIGATGHLSTQDLFRQLSEHYEVGSPTLQYARYRPAFYILRLSECWLWGNEPRLWYGARLVFFGVSLAIFWNLLGRCLGGVTGSLMLLFLLTYPFWTDIWCRLGPAEIYGVVGVAFYLAGAVAICRQTPLLARHWGLLVLGALIAMGSKENFLPILPFTWLLAGWLAWRRRLGWAGLVGTFVVSAAGLTIGAVVALSLKNVGNDVHAQQVDLWQRLRLAGDLARMIGHRPEGKLQAVALTLVVGLAFAGWRAGRWSELAPVLYRGGLGLLAGAAVLASQYFFYNGHWPRNNRYDFPGLLALPLMAVTLVWMILALLERFGWSGPAWRGVFVLALATVVLGRGYGPLIRSAHDNAVRTRCFEQDLARIVPSLQEDPGRPVLFVSHQVQDFEPLTSVRRFLRFRSVSNPLFLRLDGYGPEKMESARAKFLALKLRDCSEQGDQGDAEHRGSRLPQERFEPVGQLPEQGAIFELHFLPGAGLRLVNRQPSTDE